MASPLEDPCTCASVLCRAIERELGEGWRLWEPETLWLELKHKGIDTPNECREKILAGRVLLNTDRATYDALVFSRTAAAFSEGRCEHDAYDDDVVGHHAWCVDEMRTMYAQQNEPMPPLDHEVLSLIALALYREGFVVAPEELSVAQEALDRLYRGRGDTSELKEAVRGIWASAKGLSVRNMPYPESPRGVQMARLASVEAFLDGKRAERTKQATRIAAV